MRQEQKKHEVSKQQQDEAASTTLEDAAAASAAARESTKKVTDLTDDLLDEIDSILEVNAEEFVAEYVQQGGE